MKRINSYDDRYGKPCWGGMGGLVRSSIARCARAARIGTAAYQKARAQHDALMAYIHLLEA